MQLALFPAGRALPEHAKGYGVQVRLDRMELHRPRQWGACWLACTLYDELGMDEFWAMDRGIPSEEVLAEMRQADPPVSYLVGTPKGRLGKLEGQLLGLPWHAVREGVDVKLLPHDEDLYVLAQSRSRVDKERAMRQRQLKRLWARLKQLSAMRLKREDLLMKLGAARAKSPAAWRLIDVELAPRGAALAVGTKCSAAVPALQVGSRIRP